MAQQDRILDSLRQTGALPPASTPPTQDRILDSLRQTGALPPDPMAQAQDPPRGVLSAIGQGRAIGVRDVGASTGRALGAVAQAPGVRQLFHALRVPQQAAVLGPMRGAAGAIRAGRRVEPWDILGGSVRAVQHDIGGREVAEAAGLEGTRAGVTGLALEIGLDPLWLFAPAKVARVLRLPELARSAAVQRGVQTVAQSRPWQKVGQPAVDFVGKRLVTDYGKPPEYVELAEQQYRAVANRVEDAVLMGKKIAELPAFEQRAVGEIMTAGSDSGRTAALARLGDTGGDMTRVRDVAEEAMQRELDIGQELVDTNLMSEQAFAQWRGSGKFGSHVRREFDKYEDPAKYLLDLHKRNPEAAARAEDLLKARAGFVGQTSSLRERLEFLSKRKDLSDELRRELGEVLEAAHPVAKGQALASRAIETRRFLDRVTDRFGRDFENLEDVAQGYKQLSTSTAYGPAAGKYFPEAIADDLEHVAKAPEKARRMMQRGVGWWKYGKVVLNPATHARNTVSNFLLASMAGLSPFRAHRYVQAARSLSKQDELFQEAKAHGSFLQDTFAGIELPKLLESAENATGLQRGLNVMRRAIAKPGEWYQYEEQLFKMAFFIDQRKMGIGAKAAADAAEQALFNYRRVPKFIDDLRRGGFFPFITFPYKALPATARTLRDRPATINRMGNVFRTFEERKGDDTRPLLPPYTQDGWMRLPGKDAAGQTRYLNLGYILPFGDLSELATLSGFAGKGGATAGLLSSPYLQLASAIVSGDDPFTGQPIKDKWGGWVTYLRHFILPPLAGGYAFDELRASAKGRPMNPLSRRAKPRGLGESLLGAVGGVRIRSFDLSEEQNQRVRSLAFEAMEIGDQIKVWMRSEHLTQEEREEYLEREMRRIKTLGEEAAELRAIVIEEPQPESQPPPQSVRDRIIESLERTGALERAE
jgi:hypothetical protein